MFPLCVEAGLVVLAAWVAALVWYWFPGGSFIVGMGGFSVPPLSRIFDIPVSIFVRGEHLYDAFYSFTSGKTYFDNFANLATFIAR